MLCRFFNHVLLIIRAVVLESGLCFSVFPVSDLVIGLAKSYSWSQLSPTINALSKQNYKSGSLVRKMGNVIGLTPSRMGIAIGRLVNAQLLICLATSVRCAETYIIFIVATDTMLASCIIQFGFTKFV